MPFNDNLRAAIERAGIDQSELARRLGVTSSAVNQWVAGTAVPRAKRMGQIADLLGIPPGTLLTQVNPGAYRISPEPNAAVVSDAPPLPDFQSLPRDVPIFGTAMGGPDGAFLLNMQDGPIDWARRPASLAGVKTVFALYCEGDSMSPWREPGSLIYVSKSRPPQIGSHVVVVLDGVEPGNPPLSYVKKLVRRTSEQLILEQYNPAQRISLPANRVREVLRVLEWEEVLGI